MQLLNRVFDEALTFSKDNVGKAVVHEFSLTDVKKTRIDMGMLQNEFASALGVSISTLRYW